MKCAQVLIVFMLAVFGAVFTQDSSSGPTVATTVSLASVTATNANSPETGTTPIPTSAVNVSVSTEPTSTVGSNVTTATVSTSFKTAETSTLEPTSIPSVSNGTTSVTPVVTTAQTTAQTTASAVCPPLSGFDGASFVGGIVLALGVIVILVIIVKCYNHQSRKNELQYSQF